MLVDRNRFDVVGKQHKINSLAVEHVATLHHAIIPYVLHDGICLLPRAQTLSRLHLLDELQDITTSQWFYKEEFDNNLHCRNTNTGFIPKTRCMVFLYTHILYTPSKTFIPYFCLTEGCAILNYTDAKSFCNCRVSRVLQTPTLDEVWTSSVSSWATPWLWQDM